MRRFLRAHGVGAIAVVLVSLYYALGVVWRRAQAGIGAPSFDTYGLYYPNLLYALESLKTGEGLFWNRYQNCGQPFFSIAINGILYPPHLIYLFLDTYSGLYVLLVIHLLIAGAGAYWLCRELGLRTTAAVCGAFFFQLSGITLLLAMWEPNLVGHYAWIPAAMAACERSLRDRKASNGVLLGVVLTLQFLAGYPPMTVFTYQLIGFRVLWQCITAGLSRKTFTGIAVVALGLVVPIGLAAVQLFPSLEFAQQSLRHRRLLIDEIRPRALSLTTAAFWKSHIWKMGYSTAFAAIPVTLSCLGLAFGATRRQALFFLLVAALYTALAFETPLFNLYRSLPLGNQFRMPLRFLWLASFCLCMAGAIGVDTLTRDSRCLKNRTKRLLLLFLLGAGLSAAFGVHWGWKAYVSFAGFAVILLAALWSPTSNRLARWLLPVAVLAALTLARNYPPFGYAVRPSLFLQKRDVFEHVRERMSLQDRMYQITKHTDYPVQRKAASIYRIPSITDYETQTSERYAALFVRLLHDGRMRSVNDFYYQGSPLPKNRALFNLLAVRFAIVDARRFDWQPQGFHPIWERGNVRILENPGALPRAFYVPKARVISDPERLLNRLANLSNKPERIVLVEKAPVNGLGSEDGRGQVEILSDHGERLTVRVEATKRGFLFVSDQLYPGWKAWVNGAPAEILRANYAFRTVAVPEGTSTVEFRYEPRSRLVGAWVSLLSTLALAFFVVLRWRTKRGQARVGVETAEQNWGDRA